MRGNGRLQDSYSKQDKENNLTNKEIAVYLLVDQNIFSYVTCCIKPMHMIPLLSLFLSTNAVEVRVKSEGTLLHIY